MAFLSQASHLGSLLLPHDAFQEHAAHVVEWSTTLSSKGSESTCILSGLTTFLHYAFTAHSDLVVKFQPIDIVGFILCWSCSHASCINGKSRAELPSTSEDSCPPLNPMERGFFTLGYSEFKTGWPS